MLASLIQKDVKQPLSIEMLAKLVPNYCGTAFYDDLAKYKTLTAALGGKKCLVVLYNIHDNKKNKLNQAGHFVLINTLAGGVEYFSSSGWSVGKELDITKSDPDIFKRLCVVRLILGYSRWWRARCTRCAPRSKARLGSGREVAVLPLQTHECI